MPRIKEGFKGQRIVVLPRFLIEELKGHPLGRELYITDIGYYPNAEFHYCERSAEEAHEYVLIYCVDGEGWYNLDGSRYALKNNQFVILPKGKAHSYGCSESSWTIYWLHFDGEKASFFSENFDKPRDIAPAVHSRIQDRLMLFEEMYATIASGYKKERMLYVTTSLFHFLGSMKFIGEYRESRYGGMERRSGKVEHAVHYMQENINKNLSLANIAKEVKLSVSYFSHLFEEKIGMSPMKYLNYLRMREACHFLDFTDLKISQISPLVGFDDALYFYRQFSKQMGMSPSQYKSRKKG